ncbi:MAG: LysR family transcriptional regulator [Rhizobiales bacterium]|nr:LysR family transcriptional regulator [Hyphomicrobiales bacterium]MBI3673857.1 LysR family transcriptional regulator [Hyphomicrobiales bacterium]
MRHAQLLAFHAVATQGGFSRAAEKLSLTQPAVSDHVRKLEETYGVQLFNRAARGAELTALGRGLFAITERLLEAEGQARELLSRAKTLDEGQLTIGADAAVHVLLHIVRFHQNHPRITLRLVTGNSAELLARLESLSIDLAVTAERPSSEAVLARRLKQDRLVAVIREESTFQKERSLSLTRLAELPLILREEGSATRRLLLEELRRRGLRPSIAIEIESREAAREAVAQGLGVAVMSEGELVPDSRLRTIRISDWQASMEEWLLCLKSRADLHIIRSFFDVLPG